MTVSEIAHDCRFEEHDAANNIEPHCEPVCLACGGKRIQGFLLSSFLFYSARALRVFSREASRKLRESCNFCRTVLLLHRTVFASGVCDTGDEPFAIRADQIEEIGAAMIDFAVD